MSDRDSLWRRDFAGEVAQTYAASENVAAVLLAGSVARGLADRFSDIEIHVFWKRSPSFEERIEACTRAGGHIDIRWDRPPNERDYHEIIERTGGRAGMVWPREDEEWSDAYFVDGVYMDVSGFVADQVEQYLADVVGDGDPATIKQMLLSAIEDGVPLVGAEIIQSWKGRLHPYPESLRDRMVRNNLSIEKDWWACDQLAARGERVLLYELLGSMQRKLIRILLGINGLYLPDVRLKWIGPIADRMRLKPERLADRLRQLYLEDPERSVDLMQQLMEEVWDLVDRELPEIEREVRSRWFRLRRPLWDSPPGGA